MKNMEKDKSLTATPSTSVSLTTLPIGTPNSRTNLNKKRKLESTNPQISDYNIAKFKVLKKLNIQLTRTNHHIAYLKKCHNNKSIPKSLRTNLTPQVPVVSSTLHLKWEEAQLNFGLTLTTILLEYWENRQKSINEEIEVIMDIIRPSTDSEEIDFMQSLIERISLNVEKSLSNNKKLPNQTAST